MHIILLNVNMDFTQKYIDKRIVLEDMNKSEVDV